MKKIFFLLLALLFFYTFAACSFASHKVVWLRSGSKSGFWPVTERVIRAAATDLGIELEILRFNNDPVLMVQMAEKSLSDEKTRPDCILFHNYKKRGEELLRVAEKYGVYAFIFNSGFPKNADVGKPRGKYTRWIGQMYPDDEYAGYILAKKLYTSAVQMEKIRSTDMVHMVALEGNRSSEASNARVRGLKRALNENAKIINHQFFHSKWKENLAMEAFSASTARYPKVTVFWTASDNMAIGITKAAAKENWRPGIDYVTGGIDLLPQNQDYLKFGKLAVSVGGHYAEGAWALILIYDYLNGKDFTDFGLTTFLTRMSALTPADYSSTVDLRKRLSDESLKDIDFKKFSRTHNPDLKEYSFNIGALISFHP